MDEIIFIIYWDSHVIGLSKILNNELHFEIYDLYFLIIIISIWKWLIAFTLDLDTLVYRVPINIFHSFLFVMVSRKKDKKKRILLILMLTKLQFSDRTKIFRSGFLNGLLPEIPSDIDSHLSSFLFCPKPTDPCHAKSHNLYDLLV